MQKPNLRKEKTNDKMENRFHQINRFCKIAIKEIRVHVLDIMCVADKKNHKQKMNNSSPQYICIHWTYNTGTNENDYN